MKHPLILPLWGRNAKTRRNVQEEAETPEASSPSDAQSERAARDQGPPKSPEFIAIPLTRPEQPQLSPVLPQPGSCLEIDDIMVKDKRDLTFRIVEVILSEWFYCSLICSECAEGMVSSVDPDQKKQSFLGLHWLPRPVISLQ